MPEAAFFPRLSRYDPLLLVVAVRPVGAAGGVVSDGGGVPPVSSALPDAIEAASPERREELSRIVVQRVVVRDRRLETIEWTPAARPFFERQRECPQGDSNP